MNLKLMEQICDSVNLNQAYRQVKANKGAPGVDGITIERVKIYIAEHKEEILQSLLDGSYKPNLVRGVQIPKPDGSKRQLGIPTVLDRVIQQAILQVLEPIFEPKFSDSSYGFRPRRGAQMALKKAKEYVQSGYIYVVDMDLEKFFDRVNHDILMERLSRHVGDKQNRRMRQRTYGGVRGLAREGYPTRWVGLPQATHH